MPTDDHPFQQQAEIEWLRKNSVATRRSEKKKVAKYNTGKRSAGRGGVKIRIQFRVVVSCSGVVV